MPTSGLVLTLHRDEAARRDALRHIRDRGDVTLGEAAGPRVAAVLECASAERAERATRELAALAGVANLEIVFVGFDETEEER